MGLLDLFKKRKKETNIESGETDILNSGFKISYNNSLGDSIAQRFNDLFKKVTNGVKVQTNVGVQPQMFVFAGLILVGIFLITKNKK